MQGGQNGKEPGVEEEEEEDLEGTNEKLIRKHQLPLSAQSAFSYIPPRRMDPPELSYFHQECKEMSLVDDRNAVDIMYLDFSKAFDKVPHIILIDKLSSKAGIVSLYDCIFKRPIGYDAKLHRCDREHAKSRGLHINDEEKARPMHVLASSVYGRRIDKPVDELIRDYVRINRVQAEFYRKNGIACLEEKSNQSLANQSNPT